MTTAIVIAFGDELTGGERIDTNSAWLSRSLAAIGIPVRMHLTAPDDLAMAVESLRFAGRQADCVVTTGGLGPTNDDLAREAVAVAGGSELHLDPEALRQVESRFVRLGRPMPDPNRFQAMFPIGSTVIRNPHGTAPGIDWSTAVDGHSTRFVMLPGVPAEAKEMWSETVQPMLRSTGAGGPQIRSYKLKCFGEGESTLERRLGAMMHRDARPLIGITVQKATITLRVMVEGRDDAECQMAAEPTLAEIHRRLGDLVFGTEEEELEDAVYASLSRSGWSLATLECDGQGFVARWLNRASASERSGDPPENALPLYRGGLVCNDRICLPKLIGFEATDAARPEDSDFCSAAANALRRLFGTDFALVLGAIPATHLARVPIAIATPNGALSFAEIYSGHPQVRGPRLAKAALNHLRLAISRNPSGGSRE